MEESFLASQNPSYYQYIVKTSPSYLEAAFDEKN